MLQLNVQKGFCTTTRVSVGVRRSRRNPHVAITEERFECNIVAEKR